MRNCTDAQYAGSLIVMALKFGETGAEVGELHQQLIEAGYSIDAAEASAQSFGPSTRHAVEDFQARHVDSMSRALAVDGIVGPSTRWALAHPGGHRDLNAFAVPGWNARMMEEAPPVRRVMAVAVAELGVREVPDGSNGGPRVDLYLAPQSGLPWCAAFVCWCWERAGDGRPFPRRLGVYSLYEDFKAAGRLLPAGVAPAAGDVFLILRGNGHGHCGLVASVTDDGLSVCTIEGNSANAVRGLIRPLSSITAIARPLGEVPT
jgi:hypothetical protein